MAILKGFKANIVVNGQELAEHDDPELTIVNSEDMIIKYIEAVPGASFEVNCDASTEFKNRNPHVKAFEFKLFLDGNRRSKVVTTISKSKFSKNAASTYIAGRKHIQSFIFSEIHKSKTTPIALIVSKSGSRGASGK